MAEISPSPTDRFNEFSPLRLNSLGFERAHRYQRAENPSSTLVNLREDTYRLRLKVPGEVQVVVYHTFKRPGPRSAFKPVQTEIYLNIGGQICTLGEISYQRVKAIISLLTGQ